LVRFKTNKMPRNPRVYVGNISSRTRERDLEYVCKKYGRIRDIAVLNGFAFVEFVDGYDAEDAIRGLDGFDMDGRRLTFQEARGPGRGRRGGYGGGGGGGYGYSSGYENNFRGSPSSPVGSGQIGGRVRGSRELCVLIEGIGPRTTWKDLKDWARRIGRVEYADIWEARGKKYGICKYESRDDYREALKKLDDTKLDGYYVRVAQDTARRYNNSLSRSRSRSRRSRRPRRSRSRSNGSHSRSRSRSGRRRSNSSKKEYVKDEGRSRSRSKEKSHVKSEKAKSEKIKSEKMHSRSKSPRKRSRSKSRSRSRRSNRGYKSRSRSRSRSRNRNRNKDRSKISISERGMLNETKQSQNSQKLADQQNKLYQNTMTEIIKNDVFPANLNECYSRLSHKRGYIFG